MDLKQTNVVVLAMVMVRAIDQTVKDTLTLPLNVLSAFYTVFKDARSRHSDKIKIYPFEIYDDNNHDTKPC